MDHNQEDVRRESAHRPGEREPRSPKDPDHQGGKDDAQDVEQSKKDHIGNLGC
jgi:hypothetical protein